MGKFTKGLSKVSNGLSKGIKLGMNACALIVFGSIAWGLLSKLYLWSTSGFPWIRQFGGTVALGVVGIVTLKVITALVLRIAVRNK